MNYQFRKALAEQIVLNNFTDVNIPFNYNYGIAIVIIAVL